MASKYVWPSGQEFDPFYHPGPVYSQKKITNSKTKPSYTILYLPIRSLAHNRPLSLPYCGSLLFVLSICLRTISNMYLPNLRPVIRDWVVIVGPHFLMLWLGLQALRLYWHVKYKIIHELHLIIKLWGASFCREQRLNCKNLQVLLFKIKIFIGIWSNGKLKAT